MKKIIYILFILLILIPGCRMFYDVGDNLLNNFSTPAKVKNKIKDPIRPEVNLSALWIGHATVLIQMDDKVIMTDPFLTNHVAEIQMRVVEPGLDIKNLDQCNIILLSHSHPDHVNFGSLEMLEDKFPHADLVFPDGIKEFLPKLDFNFVTLKMPDYRKKKYIGSSKIVGGVKITAVAAYHWGGRYGIDGLLWGSDDYCGFIIEYKGMTVYYAGDTAYDKDFYKYLGDHYNIDLELMPIGPCKDCEKIDKPNRHVYPKGVLQILDDTKAKLMIPIHYGTIAELSDPNEPKYVLQDLIKARPEYEDRVKILEIGEQIVIK